ncbi:MAG: hypothetical protein JXQ72_04250 [Anaerolineae bacterium]|nr:hypothetical protein [Anaerolineae bacterium]
MAKKTITNDDRIAAARRAKADEELIPQIAREMGVQPRTVETWITRFASELEPEPPLSAALPAAASRRAAPRRKRPQTHVARVNLRPTLVIGLGGSGHRVVVHLKARLHEQLGEDTGYDRVIKLLAIDTANENFTARQPNHPDLEPVRLAPDREFVRISDVPLHDLMYSKETNEAIAAIFPEVLHSTHIDQGAQQIRRLGRIALFYHYTRIKSHLTKTIAALRGVDVIGHLDHPTPDGKEMYITDRNRLRVIIVGSVCGGTGGGTFIDMAYLVRHIAKQAGIASTRAVDVIGMLFLPGVFPEIVTTGAARIRGNAYASLLDLEYYNQATGADESLYRVNLPNEPVEVSGAPFSLCYLVDSSGTAGTVRGMTNLAPVLADALVLMTASRVGEQLDATLDNVRPSLALYHGGFRAFYSALGMAQIVHPLAWLTEQFALRLKRRLITDVILLNNRSWEGDRALAGEVDAWRTRQVRVLPGEVDTGSVGWQFNQAVEGVEDERNLADGLRSGFQQAMRVFQQTVVPQVQTSRLAAREELRRALVDTVNAWMDASLIEGRGLYSVRWQLQRLQETIRKNLPVVEPLDHHAELERQLEDVYDAASMPLVGALVLRVRVRRRVENALHSYLTHIALNNVIAEAERDLLLDCIDQIDEHIRRLNRAIQFWEGERDQVLAGDLPDRSLVTEMVIPRGQLNEHLNDRVKAVRLDDDLLRSVSGALGGLSASLDLAQHERIHDDLVELCRDKYETDTDYGDVIKHIREHPNDLRLQEMIRAMSEKATPLLVYSRGLLQALPPREVKVLGAYSEADGKEVIEPFVNNSADLSIVETHTHSAVSLLVTDHGIPASVLSEWDDYRRHYEELQDQHNPIFHLDTARENQPYDPGSFYFVNLDEFHVFFGRALAYGWIDRVEDAAQKIPKCFALRREFYTAVKDLIDADLRRMKNDIERMQQAVAHPDESEGNGVMARRRLDMMRQHRQSLQNDLNNTFAGVIIDRADSINTHYIVMRDGYPAETLDVVRDALFGGESRLLPPIFIRAVKQMYKEWDQQVHDEADIRVFLDARQYGDAVEGAPVQWVDRPMMWSEPGQRGYDLEVRLCALLNVYRRALRKKGWQRRAGYFEDWDADEDGS